MPEFILSDLDLLYQVSGWTVDGQGERSRWNVGSLPDMAQRLAKNPSNPQESK